RQRTRPGKNQRHQASDVEEVDFVPRRAELGPRWCQTDRVDGTESVLDVNDEHGTQHRDDQWNAYDGDKCPYQDRQAAKNLQQRHEPGVSQRQWHVRLFQKLGERSRSATPLGPSMDHEPYTDDHPNRYGNPSAPAVAIQLVNHVDSGTR